jgi:DNA-binding beta-propeller fold protein YncE
VTDDAVWITSQLGRGLSRIDPATNTADVRAGGWAPCWGPAIGADYLWQLACDAGVIMRIDLATNESTDIYADDYLGVGFVGATLVAVAPDGLERLDPATAELEPLGDKPEGLPVAFDDLAIWWASGDGIRRVSVADGAVLATVPVGGEVTVTFAGDRAWVTQFGGSVHEVDAATGAVLRTLALGLPSVAREADGVVWVTSFDSSTLSRLAP